MINIVNTDGCYLVDDRLFMMQLSLSAQHLWFLLDGKHTKEELYSLMSAKFDLSSENAVIVTNECLSSFKIYGLVKLDR
jgi:hypothetical protein